MSYIFSYFSDPILRAPTLGCMLMCLIAGLVGALVFLRKQSLIGEALSHASYPGVIMGVMGAGALALVHEGAIALCILVGAALSSMCGLWSIQHLERKLKVPSDTALCFILSAFFGIGLTMASEVQFSHTTLYKQAQIYLYGQAATMLDIHIFLYGILACFVITAIAVFYKEFQIIIFDRSYAKSVGIKTGPIDVLLLILIVVAVIVGIRSIGVVLMSAMLVAPPVAARQFTNRLSLLLGLSAFFGAFSGWLGNILSVELTYKLSLIYPQARIVLPTGPMIVLVASAVCAVALLFAPQRGILFRLYLMARFRFRCIQENILKEIGRREEGFKEIGMHELLSHHTVSWLYLRVLLWRMLANGWLQKNQEGYALTSAGALRAAKITHLHRLWEMYLSERDERVHCSMEEMERLLTPDLELRLTRLLDDAAHDSRPVSPQEQTHVC